MNLDLSAPAPGLMCAEGAFSTLVARGDESAQGTPVGGGTTFEGEPHACGATLRYAANGKCVACVLAWGRSRHAARIAREGNYHAGLKDGFVRLGTLAHRILHYIHVGGPTLHADLVEAMPGEVGLSANLSRLVMHGFLHRAGRQAYRAGVRSGYLFSLKKPHNRVSMGPPTTPRSCQHRYRAARALKVPSVFEFRGSMSL